LATITLRRFALCSSVGPNTEHFSCSANHRTSSEYCISKRDDEIFKVLFLIKKYADFLFFNESEVLILIQIVTIINSKKPLGIRVGGLVWVFFSKITSAFCTSKRVGESRASSISEHENFSV